ncbi:hypothetical protein DCAR_0519833 [Daucus carota subsp. sativus]|uniref:Uncharacterized protein n=1 Tax=Daucus carota subsp. sativus TaxID=79200 RepID=A0A164Y7V5_DAUCS|nr:hypothetical protein DCAR_0519833 [Daucus carota subsp. sativus]
MIFVPVFDDSDDGSKAERMEPRNIYKAKVDMSGVPKIFGRFEGGGSLYQYPEDDTELLGLCWQPSAKMRCLCQLLGEIHFSYEHPDVDLYPFEDVLKV